MKPLSAWPLDQRRQIRGILTDIDDTLTTGGRLTPGVLAALDDLRAAGLRVIAVTGRPTYWAMPLLRLCGFDAVIAENGASAFWLDTDGKMQCWFYAQAAERAGQRAALEAFAVRMQQRFPHLHPAEDAPLRIGDFAFDIGESRPAVPAEEVDRIVAFIRESGFFTTVSSIHVHASLTQFCKQATSARILSDVFGVDDTTARASYVFIGDSINDARMFAHYPHAVGVANVAHHLPRLPVAPVYVTRKSCGAGFVEMAAAILSAHAPPVFCTP